MKVKAIMKALIYIVVSTFITVGCGNGIVDPIPYNPPCQTGDGLSVGTLEQVKMDTELMAECLAEISSNKFGEIHSMLVYKDSLLVYEEYFSGHRYQWDAPGHIGEYVAWGREMQHCIHSDTKSITSLCIGIAVDEGFIESVDQSIFDYLPEYRHLNKNNKQCITIEHILTMNSGLKWDEWGVSLASVENDQIGIWFWEDGPMEYVLSRDFIAEPGTRFNYSGGDIQILAEILENATGMPLDKFSEKYLFEPMGITSFDWWLVFESGEIQAAGGLKLTPRDMIKIGAMMLNHGKWNGKQIITEAWISSCSVPFHGNSGIKIPGEDLGRVGYAYTWWTKEFHYQNHDISMYFAVGWGGQKIMIIPELDLVIAFTGANYTSKVHQFKILEDYILPSIN